MLLHVVDNIGEYMDKKFEKIPQKQAELIYRKV